MLHWTTVVEYAHGPNAVAIVMKTIRMATPTTCVIFTLFLTLRSGFGKKNFLFIRQAAPAG